MYHSFFAVAVCTCSYWSYAPKDAASERTLGMNKESLRRLIECEKNAKASIEEAKRECDMMKNKADADAMKVVGRRAREYEQILVEEEKHIKMEVQSEMCKIEEETQKKIEEIRSNTHNLEELVDHIVKKIAFISKAPKPAQPGREVL